LKALAIRVERSGSVSEVREYLASLEDAYVRIYAFDFAVNELRQRSDETISSSFREPSRKRSARFPAIRNPQALLLPGDQLTIHRIEVASPGFWEVLGALNPLETIRKYIADRHERTKDREYRNDLDLQERQLEIEKRRIEVVRERVDLLHSLGVPEEQIRRAVVQLVSQPLGQLDRIQDSRLISTAELVEIPARSSGDTAADA
jgi:hypothetical protein